MPTDYFRGLKGEQSASPRLEQTAERHSEAKAERKGLDVLSPRSIRSKLIISLLFIYFLGSLATLLALFSLSRMQGKIEFIELFYELNQKILETRRYEKNFLLYGNPRDLMSAQDYLDEVRVSLGVLRRTPAFSQTAAHAMLPEQEAKLETYADFLKRLNAPDLPAETSSRLKVELREQGHALTQSVLEMDTLARREVERTARRYRDVAIVVLVSASVFGAALTFLLVHWIIGPLQSIRYAASRIMRGELTAIPLESSCRSSIECTELVDSLNLMLHTLEAKQNQLVQSAKLAALGRVTAGIAHEINNPLNNIYLTAEVLLEDLPNLEDGEQREMVDDILTQADRAREVVHHLLDFSRSREQSVGNQVDVVKLVKETLVLLRNQIRLGQIHVHTDLPEEPLSVMGNANQLQQVFVNIILNAVQAMGIGGILSLRVRPSDDAVLLEFTDTGPGIPEDIKAQIFDPFFTTKSDGTGLGLSVSYSIIKEHKGDIILESDPDAGTTTFRVVLPRPRKTS